jgi:hypothetical protein
VVKRLASQNCHGPLNFNQFGLLSGDYIIGGVLFFLLLKKRNYSSIVLSALSVHVAITVRTVWLVGGQDAHSCAYLSGHMGHRIICTNQTNQMCRTFQSILPWPPAAAAIRD